ncbi:RBP11-like subunits of RNA polymerase [Viridothelium virens]|uniref:RBP11-like subunits of RNA polymerase n=1 Tax=Viridothelium virens TaxID=1048519 RepID=A0A6A6HKH8_VIRVR|nr:RBP11-like subunits of RNA polymerase [Viridothelium virens]
MSQGSQDRAMSNTPDAGVEVPMSSALVAEENSPLPSTPTARKETEGEEDTVLETPRQDTSQTTMGDDEGQADVAAEQTNGEQANGIKKKERPAFNPYDTAPIIPRSPLEIGLDEQRLRVLPGSLDDAASFEFLHEDHTLGNALRHVIMKNPAVELAGYTIPHPSESKMHLRIQMYDGASAYDALEQGIDDLDDMCDEILKKFEAAKEEFMDVEEQTQAST